MCNYKCPNADRRKCANFILCKGLEKDGVNYNDRQNAMTVICMCQKQCMKTGRMENSEGAKECYERMNEYAILTAVDTKADLLREKIEAEVEADKVPTVTTSRKKKSK